MGHGLSCSAACRILPDQGSNLCPPHWQAASPPLSHQGSPYHFIFKPYKCTILFKKLKLKKKKKVSQTPAILATLSTSLRVNAEPCLWPSGSDPACFISLTCLPHSVPACWLFSKLISLLSCACFPGGLLQPPCLPPGLVSPSCCYCSVAKSRPTCSMPGFPVLQYLLGFAQIQVH